MAESGLALRRPRWEDYRQGVLAGLFADEIDGPVFEVSAPDGALPAEGAAVLFAPHWLEATADYRGTLQAWFAAVRPGGHLVLVVSHSWLLDRQFALPSRWRPEQRRLYTPRSLLDEVEEALAPNSYRVRFLADDDTDYDYARSHEAIPAGRSDIVLVLQKIAPPEWALDAPAEVRADAPDYAFAPPRTRVETYAVPQVRKVLMMKLDHLGDFIVSQPAFRRAREMFADAELTLVVGSWNADLARDLGLADHVIAFDAFPPNSTEEEVDVPGKTGLFRAAVPGSYDLAIDLRTDHDTRRLLAEVDARLHAGIGTRTQFPFLDIFLPIDATRNEYETAKETEFKPHDFPAQGSAIRTDHRVLSMPDRVERQCAIIWGPYRRLRAGRYFFEPYLDLAADTRGGSLLIDVALDTRRVVERYLPAGDVRLPFEVKEPESDFEFRIWTVPDVPSIEMSFFGGRLVRQGAASVLHQAEYQALLLELISLRLNSPGVLGNVADG